jgi:hypothetical protein
MALNFKWKVQQVLVLITWFRELFRITFYQAWAALDLSLIKL